MLRVILVETICEKAWPECRAFTDHGYKVGFVNS